MGNWFKDEKQERSKSKVVLAESLIDQLKQLGYTVEKKTPYQIRVNNQLDLFVVNNKYHDIKNGKRGRFKDALELVKTFQFSEVKHKTFITINVDASFDHETKIASYAFWLRSPNHANMIKGVFKTPINTSNEAELYAIANALAYVAKNVTGNYFALIINTDCLGAIGCIRSNKTPPVTEIIKGYEILIKQNLQLHKIIYKHVKGHTNSKKPKALANNYAHNEAIELMRNERKKKKQ
jgi:ribonuclease HI